MATKDGKKTGGRKKGVKNKKDKSHVEKAKQSGLMPVDYMLLVMRDCDQDTAVRMDAAKSAAPYLTPKLAPIIKKEDDSATDWDAVGKALAEAMGKADSTP